jgi:GTP-binding protein HflX
LLSAFRSTLEEIAGSRLLLHVVDAGNPRWQQQVGSAARLLTELEFNPIPRLLVFNKTDTVDRSIAEAIVRTTSIRNGGESIAISALHAETLGPLLLKIGEALGPAIEQYQRQQMATQLVQ